MLTRRASSLAFVALIFELLGCSSRSDREEVPDAYPNRRPTLASPGHALAYVANRLSDSISVVDLDAGTLLGNAPVGRDPVDTDGPWHVVVDRNTSHAFVAYSYPDANVSPHASSLGNNGRLGYVAALGLSDFRLLAELRLDVSAADVALSPDGNVLAVAHFDTLKALVESSPEARRAHVAFVSPAALAQGTAMATRVEVCAAPSSIAFGEGGTRLFVACTGDDTLTVIDVRSGSVMSRVVAGQYPVNKPYALALDQAREHLLVSNQVSASAVMFSVEDNPTMLSVAEFDSIPMFADFDADAATYIVALQNPDGAARVDSASGSVQLVKRYSPAECERPSAPRRSSSGRWVLVCQGNGYDSGSLVELDPRSLAVSSPIPLGVLPERVEVLEP